MSQKDMGAAVTLLRGELGARVTQCGLGRGLLLYQVATSSISRLATVEMGRKLGRGELGPHLTQCRLGQGLLSTKWHLDPCSRLAAIDIDRKLGGSAPFSGDRF